MKWLLFGLESGLISKPIQTDIVQQGTLKTWFNEPQYSEFCDIVNKTQIPFWGFTEHITFDIVNILYTEQKGSDGLVCYIVVWMYYQ